eukprot:TRINITY_DN860_c0_g1_i2.p1 TRINITY_DN860_c0_g1~~TRINITY_DN860_c0_g1_i2.p1  ORF type:complete len:156 (-),score=19.88 TRINITY_DN860_c0_g1_i2:62-529(-)
MSSVMMVTMLTVLVFLSMLSVPIECQTFASPPPPNYSNFTFTFRYFSDNRCGGQIMEATTRTGVCTPVTGVYDLREVRMYVIAYAPSITKPVIYYYCNADCSTCVDYVPSGVMSGQCIPGARGDGLSLTWESSASLLPLSVLLSSLSALFFLFFL